MAKANVNHSRFSSDDEEISKHPDDNGVLKPGPGRESFKLAAFWKDQIQQHDRAYAKWHQRGNTILKRFRDERNKIDEEGQRKMNLLWANYKIMKPAIYSKCPTPVVDRTFLDHDPIGRLSSKILERCLKNEIKNNFHMAVTQAVADRLLPGRGIVWPRYEPKIGEGSSIPSYSPTGIEDQIEAIHQNKASMMDIEPSKETDEEEQLEETGTTIVDEKVVFDYIDWKRLYCFPAKACTWEEIQAIGKEVYISKKEAIEKFGEEIGKQMQPDTTSFPSSNTKASGYTDAAIFRDINERTIKAVEIWNKSDQKIYWVSQGYQYLCGVEDDPLELTTFFSTPRPLTSTLTNDSVIPVPDYWEWQDLAIQIDELTARIAMLTKACKVAGAYDSSCGPLERLLNESVENKLIPVANWVKFAESGGFKGAIAFLPLEEIQATIKTLQEVRQQAMVDLDQVTGLSDVLRGTTDSRETLGGIRLKNNNAGTRLSDSQEDVARFCRDLICIAAEMICRHFSDETLIITSGILYEEELQPDVVMDEWYMENVSSDPSQQGQIGQQQNQQIGQQTPQQPQLPAPNQSSLQQPPTPQPQQQGNVIPFPGGSQQQSQQPTPLIPQQPQPPDPKILILMKVQKAIKLLRDEASRNYRIDIETDSTIFGDRVQDRQDSTEFVGALAQFMQGFGEIAQQEPESLPLLAKTLQWAVRKYRTGRDLEAEVDNFVAKMVKKAKLAATQGPQPSPDQIKAQAEQQKHQMEIKKTQMELDGQAQNDQRDAAKQQQKAHMDQQKMTMEFEFEKERMAMEREKMQMDIQLAREKHRMEMEKLRAGAQVKVHEANIKAQSAQQEHAMDMHSQQQEQVMQEHQMHQEAQHQEKEHQLKTSEMHMQHQQAAQQHHQKMQQGAQQHKQTIEQGKQQHQFSQAQHKNKMTEAKHKPKAKKNK